MIGIYKITNKLNGKIYIGQSNNIERRFYEHQTKGKSSRIPVDVAIEKYGKDNFLYEVVEETNLDNLNQAEQFWIQYFNSIELGYNCSEGGDQQSIGENNGRSKLTESDVIIIRQAYQQHQKQKDVYQQFKNIISYSYFQNVWQGRSWSHIMPEVFTPENKQYYIYQNSQGQKSSSSQLSDDEVIEIRKRYVNESARQIYADYQSKISYQTLQAIMGTNLSESSNI